MGALLCSRGTFHNLMLSCAAIGPSANFVTSQCPSIIVVLGLDLACRVRFRFDLFSLFVPLHDQHRNFVDIAWFLPFVPGGILGIDTLGENGPNFLELLTPFRLVALVCL